MFDGAKRKTTLGPQTSECEVKNKQTNKQTNKKKKRKTLPFHFSIATCFISL